MNKFPSPVRNYLYGEGNEANSLKSTIIVLPSRPPRMSVRPTQRALSCQSELGSAISQGTQNILSPTSFKIQLSPNTLSEAIRSSTGSLGRRQPNLNPAFLSSKVISQTWYPFSSPYWTTTSGLLMRTDRGHFGARSVYSIPLSHRRSKGLIPHTWKLMLLLKYNTRRKKVCSR